MRHARAFGIVAGALALALAAPAVGASGTASWLCDYGPLECGAARAFDSWWTSATSADETLYVAACGNGPGVDVARVFCAYFFGAGIGPDAFAALAALPGDVALRADAILP